MYCCSPRVFPHLIYEVEGGVAAENVFVHTLRTRLPLGNCSALLLVVFELLFASAPHSASYENYRNVAKDG